jgi:undecaprenyl diphosphate synthase
MEKKVPLHLGLIVDGNRRWAEKRNLPFLEGHKKGLDNLEVIGDYALKMGVKILTIYAFSTENWDRSKNEVNYLIKLLAGALSKKNIQKNHKKGIKMKIIGQKEKLSTSLQKKIKEAEKLTENNKNGVLSLAISYGGRADIVHAVKKIIKKRIKAEKITEELITKNLWTVNNPYPDLIIRTGGECRLSNFLTWESAYSELYFSSKLWPDFTKEDLEEAIFNFGKRKRRFGK